ncbi:MAG: hypothetical protein M1819_006446 [Sarea resinae]|nr:MAG: hypothetical protein M1819_006446 [Sarea resinae]
MVIKTASMAHLRIGSFLSPTCLAFLLLVQVAIVSAQTITPANDTAFFQPSPDTQLVLKVRMNDNALQTFFLQPLTSAAGYAQSVSTLEGLRLSGDLTLTDATTVVDLASSQIAFMSCDNATYAGYIPAASVLDSAASKDPPAIVLYSDYSANCRFSSGSSFNYTSLYSMTRPDDSSQLQSTLLNAGDAVMAAVVLWNTTADKQAENSTSSGYSSTSSSGAPTTAVAMIILYSITGVITATFLTIIVTGAVRAHRHPERYGPRNVRGRPRQSRARGIARAMLETLPIVKFGEREEDKSRAADVELGSSEAARDADQGAEVIEGRAPVEAAGVSQDRHATEGGEVEGTKDGHATTSGGSGEASPAAEHTETQTSPDEGLVCSICTDDFIKGQDIRVLPCKHMFHPECIDPWLLNVSGTCPLCRVDLHPTISNTSNDENNDDNNTPANQGRNFFAPPLSLDHSTADSRRRSRHAISTFLQNTLNVHRMRDATPEERVAALRTLREHNRGLEEATRAGERVNWRDRFGGRLRTRLMGGRAGASTSGPSTAAADQEEIAARACGDEASNTPGPALQAEDVQHTSTAHPATD